LTQFYFYDFSLFNPLIAEQIIKNGLFFEKGEHLLQNGILHFVFKFSQSSEIALES